MNLDERLNRASHDLHMVVAERDPQPIAAVARHHNVMRFAVASTALVTVTAAVGIIAVEGGGPAEQSSSSQPVAGASITTSTTTTTLQDAPIIGEARAVDLSSIDITAAVAPFDHETNVESLLLEIGLGFILSERLAYVSDCMATAGFDGPEPVVLPSRDDPLLISNGQFPPTDLLAADGFVFLPSAPASVNNFEANEERDNAAVACFADKESWHLDSDRTRASELHRTLRDAWEEVLTDVNSTDTVQLATSGFSSCLVNAGIPDQYSGSVGRYLGYMDSVLADVVDDFSQSVEISEEFGKLYAECGRDLFETRERLRSGDRRTTFLGKHADAIRELSDLVGASGN